MLPILVAAAIFSLIGYNVAKRSKDPLTFGHPPRVGAVSVASRHARGFDRFRYRGLLAKVIERGLAPSRALLECAYGEAAHHGDRQSMQLILDLACPPASQKQESKAPEPEDGKELDLSEYESANPGVASPITSATPEEWEAFCAALRTKEPSWANDRYVGAFEHNRDRLRQLGIDTATLADEDAQQQALATDMADYYKSSAKLIEDFAGDVIDVNGQPTPVTASGILALLKAAGPRGAESWLRNEADRSRFPRTTATFLRANNCF